MNAYAPRHAADAWATLALVFAVARVRPLGAARFAAWALVVGAVGGVLRVDAREPAGFRMLAVIGTLLYAMKGVVVSRPARSARSRSRPGPGSGSPLSGPACAPARSRGRSIRRDPGPPTSSGPGQGGWRRGSPSSP